MAILVDNSKCAFAIRSCHCGDDNLDGEKNCQCECYSIGTGCNCGCNDCIEVCPTGALIREEVLMVNYEKCIDCGACIEACPHQALSLI